MKLLLIIALLCMNNFSAPAGETKLCTAKKVCNTKQKAQVNPSEAQTNLPMMPSLLIVDIY